MSTTEQEIKNLINAARDKALPDIAGIERAAAAHKNEIVEGQFSGVIAKAFGSSFTDPDREAFLLKLIALSEDDQPLGKPGYFRFRTAAEGRGYDVGKDILGSLDPEIQFFLARSSQRDIRIALNSEKGRWIIDRLVGMRVNIIVRKGQMNEQTKRPYPSDWLVQPIERKLLSEHQAEALLDNATGSVEPNHDPLAGSDQPF